MVHDITFGIDEESYQKLVRIAEKNGVLLGTVIREAIYTTFLDEKLKEIDNERNGYAKG